MAALDSKKKDYIFIILMAGVATGLLTLAVHLVSLNFNLPGFVPGLLATGTCVTVLCILAAAILYRRQVLSFIRSLESNARWIPFTATSPRSRGTHRRASPRPGRARG